MKIDRNKVLMLFALTLLTTALVAVNLDVPASAEISSEPIHLHGQPLQPIHMHSNITLNPIHMHHTQGILWPGVPPITEPNCTTNWIRIEPDVDPIDFELWHLTSWEDWGEPFGELSQNDQIDMNNTETGKIEWFHVDRMTLTLNLSGPYMGPYHEPGPTTMLLELKQPYCHPYDPFIVEYPNFTFTTWHQVWPIYSPVFTITDWMDDPANKNGILDFTDSISFDQGFTWWHVEDVATDLILRWKMMDPIGTWWHELYPDYCEWYNLTSWSSFPDPWCDRISPKDTIDMFRLSDQSIHWYFVDRVTITINVTREEPPYDWMMLELKTHDFEEMYHWIKKPINSTWHSVYPEYCSVFNLSFWDPMDPLWDNCNGVLDPCDNIELQNITDPISQQPEYGVYHITDMSYDIILNEYITDPVCTDWHELHPDCTQNIYHIQAWENNTMDVWLSPCDNVTLSDPTGLPTDYHVENVTLTLDVTILDISGSGPFMTIGETIYLEHIQGAWNYSWPRLYHPKIEPLDTNWTVVCPIDYFGEELMIWYWFDNCNGVLSYCDELVFLSPTQQLVVHVDEVAVDMVVKKIEVVTPVHDVAVIDVFSLYPWVYQGQVDPINVTVENQGNQIETVDVYAFYDSNLAAPKQTITLNSGQNTTLTFNWDTTTVAPGTYTVSANATIAIDDDSADNTGTGNQQEVREPPPFYWKENYTDYAPSGVPDFDERQDAWQKGIVWTWCGPTAAGNSIWWMDSRFHPSNLVTAYPGAVSEHDPSNVPPFIEHLAYLMDTDGNRTQPCSHTGTLVQDMITGIIHYLSWTGVNPQGDVDGDGDVDNNDWTIVNNAMGTQPGVPGWNMRADIWPVTTGWPSTTLADNNITPADLALVNLYMGLTNGTFEVHDIASPLFPDIEFEVERCEDVILLIAPWKYVGDPPFGSWVRDEDFGHFVTVAGIDSNMEKIAFSDPIRDAFEFGLTPEGRVLPPSVVHGHPGAPPDTTHNNASLVSHDIYNVTDTHPCPGGPWSIENFPGRLDPTWTVQIEHAVIMSPIEVEEVCGVNITNVMTSHCGTPVDAGFTTWTITVNVTVHNNGTTPINCTVNAYYYNATNTFQIGSAQNINNLDPCNTATRTFNWNLSNVASCKNFTVKANVTADCGASDEFVKGQVRIRRTGDVSGEDMVTGLDVLIVTSIANFMKTVPPADVYADVSGECMVTGLDVLIITSIENFMKGCP